MEWHKDDALYNPVQIEVVYTIENNSDCVTKWEINSTTASSSVEASATATTTADQRIEVETDANSAIFIKAGPNGVSHCVSSLKSGSRSILKFVFIEEGAELLDDAKQHLDQFNKNTKKKKTKRRR